MRRSRELELRSNLWGREKVRCGRSLHPSRPGREKEGVENRHGLEGDGVGSKCESGPFVLFHDPLTN